MSLKFVWFLSIVLVSLSPVSTLICQLHIRWGNSLQFSTSYSTGSCPSTCRVFSGTSQSGTKTLVRDCGSEERCNETLACEHALNTLHYRKCTVDKCCDTDLCNAGPEFAVLGGSYYFFSKSGETWTDNRAQCQGDGGDLVSMENEDEWNFISGKINELTIDEPQEWHIGLKKVGVNWQWVSGEQLTYDKWRYDGQPSGDGDFVVMSKNDPSGARGRFNDLANHHNKAYICEYPLGTTMEEDDITSVNKKKIPKEFKDFIKFGEKSERSHSKKEHRGANLHRA